MRFLLVTIFAFIWVGCSNSKEERWYRGNTHAHSLWSDGNDFPEMIIGWYKDRGYDFMALSDHNILAVGEQWISLEAVEKRQRVPGPTAFEKYVAKYGADWVVTRETDGKREVRLRRIDECRALFDEPERFLVVQAEEISNSAQGKPVHINAVNLPGDVVIPGIKNDATVRELMRLSLRQVADLERETGQAILTHLNHPNFHWAITAEDLAHVVEEQFFEVYNGHPGINHLGDADHPGDEKIWDIANTIRLAELNAEPLYGVATDDSHTYHGGNVSPGRGWIMVKAPRLEGDALVTAMRAGRFYASSGVTLEAVNYDSKTKTLSLVIQPEPGVTYSTQWIGTRKNYDPGSGIGEVFEEKSGTTVELTVPPDALYARATITSSKPHPNPSFDSQTEQAWTQPVGWEK